MIFINNGFVLNRQILILGCLIFIMAVPAGWAEEVKIRIQGSTTVNPVVTEAAEHFHQTRGWTVLVDTQGGSSGGISAVGEGLADIGMSSKPLSEQDRQRYATVNFQPVSIGIDGVAIIVSEPVYLSGVTQISRAQMQALYEKRITNWQDLGGDRRRVVFYNKEPGRGTWEVFANWAYDGAKNAPLVNHPEVGSNEETRNKVGHHPGAISQLSYAWTESSSKIRALDIMTDEGEVIPATLENIQSGVYPLARQLYVITADNPRPEVREFIEYLLSQDGQRLVSKHGYLPIH